MSQAVLNAVGIAWDGVARAQAWLPSRSRHTHEAMFGTLASPAVPLPEGSLEPCPLQYSVAYNHLSLCSSPPARR